MMESTDSEYRTEVAEKLTLVLRRLHKEKARSPQEFDEEIEAIILVLSAAFTGRTGVPFERVPEIAGRLEEVLCEVAREHLERN